MTVSTTTNREIYDGNGITTVFSYPFRIVDQTHLKVYLKDALGNLTLQVLGSDYTVSGVGDALGGEFTMAVAPPSGVSGNVIVLRDVPFTQLADYTENDDFPAETHERALDLLTMLTQQLNDALLRSLLLPVSSGISGLTLPDPTANYLLGWNSAGDDLENKVPASIAPAVVVSPFIATLIDDVDAAAARATLGAAADLSYARLDVEDQALTGGVIVTSKSLGTISSGTVTPDPGDRPLQHYTNGGAHTLAPSTNKGSILVDITNNGSAGAITTSGFTKVAGDAFTTTNGNKFRCHISVGDAGSLLNVQAMQ